MKKPLISIITVCFNAEKDLATTIANIAKQTYSNIEYIVIDGKSSDNTRQVLEKNAQFIQKWISEKDNGIYDAMRKGVNLASGEWINFMNAGDIFEKESIIEDIFMQNLENKSLIYGDYAVQYETYREIIKAENLNELWTSVRFCHQSAFYRKDVIEKFPFSDGLIVADFEQAWKMYRAGYAFFYFPQVIARFAHTGVSARTKKRIQSEIEAIICKDDKRLSTKMKFFLRKMRVRIVETVRGILPTQFFEFLQKIKTKIFAGKKQVY